MSIRIVAVDIGGQGVKAGRFTINEAGLTRDGEYIKWRPSSWSQFDEELLTNLRFTGCHVGVSCAGFVDSPNGMVTCSKVTGWSSFPIVKRLKSLGATSAVVLNDAEAHLLAHHDEPLPLLNVALGTSIGVAALDDQGKIIKSHRNGNLDVGCFRLHTSASPDLAWAALGAKAYQELIRTLGSVEGIKRYSARLGAFLGQLSNIFQPKSIVVSGGLTESQWEKMHMEIIAELGFACPDWLERPVVMRSRHGSYAGLVGVAFAASNPKLLNY